VLAAAAIAAAQLGTVPIALAGSAERVRERIVEGGRRRLGRPFRGDCSGYVLAVLGEAGVAVRLPRALSRSESLHRAARAARTPLPGDLAFFHHTYDRNRDGFANDRFTHVALVETVDGTSATLLHRSARGIERIRIDLSRPSDPKANDPVRALRRGEDPRTRILAGELFAGWGTVVP
jgi:hypothetical protein